MVSYNARLPYRWFYGLFELRDICGGSANRDPVSYLIHHLFPLLIPLHLQRPAGKAVQIRAAASRSRLPVPHIVEGDFSARRFRLLLFWLG